MTPGTLSDWPAVGARVTQARRALSLTQEQLGATVGLGRTVVAKIERGNRTLSALELAQLAQATDLPIDWFVTESPPVVASHRSADPSMTHLVDVRVEVLAREVMQLLEADLLKPAEGGIRLALPRNVAEAERAAMAVREHLGLDEEAFIDLGAAAEKLSLFAYSLALPGSQADGAYVAADEQAGVALINGVHPSGRRRFTLAHEIGHHVFQDEYAIDQDLDTDTERLINAFAIHLLLPRAGLLRRWDALGGPDDHRHAAIVIAAESRVSWTALCGHLVNLGLLDPHAGAVLAETLPNAQEYAALGISIAEELAAPAIPQSVRRAVFRGYRRHRLGTGRALELLHGAVAEDDLPEQDQLPLEALAGELRSRQPFSGTGQGITRQL